MHVKAALAIKLNHCEPLVGSPADLFWLFSNPKFAAISNFDEHNHNTTNFRLLKITYLAAIYFDFNDPIYTNQTMSVVFDPTSVEEPENTDPLVIYPNPSNDFINVMNLNETVYYKVTDALGRIIQDGSMSSQAGLNISGYQPGMYLLTIFDNNSKEQDVVLKFIKS